MSVFCFDEEPCHDRPVILDGALDVVNVCSIVKAGCNVATSIEPLRYLSMSVRLFRLRQDCTHPIANVLQSFEGAIAVMGSNMVRVETCSDVDDSNNVIEPCEFPVAKLALTEICTLQEGHTKCDVAVAHETCNIDWLICSKSGNLASGQKVPSYAGIPCIIADSEPTCTAVTRIVDRYPSHIFVMSLKPPLDCQGIVVEDEDCVTLRIQQVRSSSGAWLEYLLGVLWREGIGRRSVTCRERVFRVRGS